MQRLKLFLLLLSISFLISSRFLILFSYFLYCATSSSFVLIHLSFSHVFLRIHFPSHNHRPLSSFLLSLLSFFLCLSLLHFFHPMSSLLFPSSLFSSLFSFSIISSYVLLPLHFSLLILFSPLIYHPFSFSPSFLSSTLSFVLFLSFFLSHPLPVLGLQKEDSEEDRDKG